eukprot:scaffold1074_cov409-Prasinococcus_capsulatus_cf.AAC.3
MPVCAISGLGARPSNRIRALMYQLSTTWSTKESRSKRFMEASFVRSSVPNSHSVSSGSHGVPSASVMSTAATMSRTLTIASYNDRAVSVSGASRTRLAVSTLLISPVPLPGQMISNTMQVSFNLKVRAWSPGPVTTDSSSSRQNSDPASSKSKSRKVNIPPASGWMGCPDTHYPRHGLIITRAKLLRWWHLTKYTLGFRNMTMLFDWISDVMF